MCNPRRVTITATRELDEEWQREVTRTTQLSAEVVGEARVNQALAGSLGPAALGALERTLAEGDDEWREAEDGTYRHDVEGGYVVYDPGSQELTIVATREDTVEAAGTATELLEGHLQTTVEAQAGRLILAEEEVGGPRREGTPGEFVDEFRHRPECESGRGGRAMRFITRTLRLLRSPGERMAIAGVPSRGAGTGRWSEYATGTARIPGNRRRSAG